MDSQGENSYKLSTPRRRQDDSSSGHLLQHLLSKLLIKDRATGEHSFRVYELVKEWAADLIARDEIKKERLESLALAAMLHDIGKLGVRDFILQKTNELNLAERTEIEMHVEWGCDLLRHEPALDEVSVFVRAHHERWDGRGYPAGLSGDQIPLESRIISIVDAFDAMTGFRPYRSTISEMEALDEIENYAGSQFCPVFAARFVRFRRAHRQ